MAQFTLKQIETFLKVAELGSFQGAANQLNTTQPAVSVRIKELENSLGIELFDRSTRQPRLTPRGRALVAQAQRIMRMTEQIRHEIADPAAMVGLIRVGVTDAVALTWLPRLIERISRTFPKLGVELQVGLSVDLFQALTEHALDVTVIAGPAFDPEVTSVPIGYLPAAWMASPNIPLPAGRVPPEVLAGRPIITYGEGSHQNVMIREWFKAQGVEPVRLSVCTSMSTIIKLTESGLGLSVLPPPMMVGEVASGRLRIVETTVPLPLQEFIGAYVTDSSSMALPQIVGMAAEIAADDPTFGLQPGPAPLTARRTARAKRG